MNIAVVGANSRTGVAFVEAALKAGHHVNAGIHHSNPFSPETKLTIMHCDSRSEKDLRSLILNQDVVVSLIGHVKGSPSDVQTASINTLINLMQDGTPKRLISLTGTGVRFDGDKIRFIDRFMNASISVIDPSRIIDGKNHVISIRQSELDWTILRVLKLQNIKPRFYILRANGPTKVIVGRDEVALALLDIIENNSFIHQAPIISY